MAEEQEESQPLLAVEEEDEQHIREEEDGAGREKHVSPCALLGALVGALAMLLLLQSCVWMVRVAGFRPEGILKGSAAAWMMSQGWRVGELQRLGAEGLWAMMPLAIPFIVLGAFAGVAFGIRFAQELRNLPARAHLHWQGLHGGRIRHRAHALRGQLGGEVADDGL